MPEPEVIPEIKEILSALLFATREPLTPRQMVNVFKRTAEMYEGVEATFIDITVKDVTDALEELRQDLIESRLGLEIAEVAGGFRMRNAKHVGPWLRELLEKGKANKLSKPALETLSIIAYRQPVQRSEIESVRGVAADSIVRNLLEMGLVKVVGRSELPGKPWLYGTTQAFLEHFGLNNLDELPGMAEMRRNLEQRELALKQKGEKEEGEREEEEKGEEEKGEEEKGEEEKEEGEREEGEGAAETGEHPTLNEDEDAADQPLV
jgi:segregation and condensation protein B